MAQNITLLGANYRDVPAVQLPKTGGGTARFDDTTDANAVASDVSLGKTCYVNGEKITGTNSGGGSGATVKTKDVTNSSATATSLAFTGLEAEPKAFFVRCKQQLTRSSNSSYYYVVTMQYDGENTYGNYWRMSNGTYYNDTSHYSFTYSNGTLTVKSSGSRSAAGGSFYNGTYELIYVY